MKTILAATIGFILLSGLNACKKETSNDNTNQVASPSPEDMASANAMNDAINKMGIYDDSLAHTSIHHHQLHYDSLYHHHDSSFWHHHNVYHHADTSHHQGNHHTQTHHHVIDSLHNVHTPHHP